MAGIRGVLLFGKFRRQNELKAMSRDEQRNALIVDLSKFSNQPVGHFQAFDDELLAGKGAILVLLREAQFRTDAELQNMSDGDHRNTLVVEAQITTGLPLPTLQGMSDVELVRLGLGSSFWTSEGGSALNYIFPTNYIMSVKRDEIRLTNTQTGESNSAKVPTEKVNAEQQSQIIKDIVAKLKDYFAKNEADIRVGKIKAEEIVGTTYALAGAAVGSVLFAPLAPVLGAIASQQGRFYGAMIDDLVATIKGEKKESLEKFVGVFATIYFAQYAGAISAVSVVGSDGWSILKSIGGTLGEGFKDSVNASVNAIKSVVDDVSESAGDAVDWLVNILKANRLQLEPVSG